MIPQIAYTNSNCEDVWEMFIEQNIKHTKMPLYIISDKQPKNYEEDNVVQYSNENPYYQVWINALNKFNPEYFIYLQEDFVLYSDVKEEEVNKCVDFLINNTQYSFIKLIKATSFGLISVAPNLFEIESTNENIFSMQPTIWRTADFIRIMDLVKSHNWFDEYPYRDKMIALNMRGAYYYENEVLRGKTHFDSNIYPYIATALVKGKWNLSEYPNELSKLLSEYNINSQLRGTR